MASHHVAISGSTGVGKTTLAVALAGVLGWRCELEDAGAENRFLAASVADPERWQFHNQVSFATQAIAQQATIRDNPEPVVQDRHLDEHHAMFCVPRHEQGQLSDDEFELLTRLTNAGRAAVGAPDLVIYAHAPAEVILERIRSRGRDFERATTLAEVQAQCERYERFIADWRHSPVLAVDTSALDPTSETQLAELAAAVHERLI